ncbi:MAG TPA: hypothetical protein VFJ85_10140 [Acidimicrobiales bacterium]|nr:hypothetical protein [Acidimicrobiales bacterium]
MSAMSAAGPAGRRREAGDYGVEFGELPPPRRRPAAPRTGSGQGRGTRGLRAVAAPSDRAHGTHAKYVVERCGCEPCRAANRDYERRRRQAQSRPDETWLPYVGAEPARRHLARLSAAGIGLKTVARLSGLSHGGLSKIVYGSKGRGPSKRIRPATLAAILAVEPAAAAGGQRVSAERTWALLDELIAAGYTRTFLAAALGSTSARPSLQLGRRRVRASTAKAVEQLHRRLIGRPPPPRRSRWTPR